MQPVTARVTEVGSTDDQGLVRRARDGDAGAFDAVAASRMPGAFRLACAILGDEADAADATQNALLAAWRELPRLIDASRFDAWFQRILVNECRMRMRRDRSRRERPLEDDDEEGLGSLVQARTSAFIDRVELLDRLETAFELLEPDDRAMVVLHHLEGRPLGEIAALLLLPVGTVKWRLHEAREVLRRALE